jgi:hypothetical protein
MTLTRGVSIQLNFSTHSDRMKLNFVCNERATKPLTPLEVSNHLNPSPPKEAADMAGTPPRVEAMSPR